VPDDNEPGPEDPTRFADTPRLEPLDEAPDGATPSDPNGRDPDALPPGANRG
jgi:hypothetical protein